MKVPVWLAISVAVGSAMLTAMYYMKRFPRSFIKQMRKMGAI